MVCTWLQHINNSLADWEDANRSSPLTLDESSDVHSTTRTHIFQIYNILATRYEVLLTWRTDPGWAAALHDAILGYAEAHFTNFASRDFHRVAARHRASHVARDRGRSLARGRADATNQASTRGDAATRAGGGRCGGSGGVHGGVGGGGGVGSGGGGRRHNDANTPDVHGTKPGKGGGGNNRRGGDGCSRLGGSGPSSLAGAPPA